MTSHAIEPMRRPWAEAVSVWRYGGEYEMYSFDGSEACVQELLDGGYYAWLNKRGVRRATSASALRRRSPPGRRGSTRRGLWTSAWGWPRSSAAQGRAERSWRMV